jgi:2-polyprenyl-6-methoxyphenol hydroxylase-like FAD-dependent oxidoreductase
VNSALLDAFTLSGCLERFAGDSAAAVKEYEAIRLPENKALIELMSVSFLAAPSCLHKAAYAGLPSASQAIQWCLVIERACM